MVALFLFMFFFPYTTLQTLADFIDIRTNHLIRIYHLCMPL